MKKKANGLLLISALGALVLSGCSLPGLDFSIPNLSELTEKLSDTNLSEAEELVSEYLASSKESSSQNGKPSSSSSKASSSSEAKSSSSSEKPVEISSSSSSAPEVISFDQYGIVKSYFGRGATLVINSDNTTSWKGSANKYPATCTRMANGIYHIVSDYSVISKYRVDVYTDGDIAYVVRNGQEYVMCDDSSIESDYVFVKKYSQDFYLWGIQDSFLVWHYMAKINGAIRTNVTVTIVNGMPNINNEGAIFTVSYPGGEYSYQSFAIENSGNYNYTMVQDYYITTTTYTGDHGDLVIAKNNNNEVVSIKIDGNDLNYNSFVGNTIYVPSTVEDTFEQTDDNVLRTYEENTYVLDDVNMTYVAQTTTKTENLFHDISGLSGTYSTEVGKDGHLWASFKSQTSGVLHLTETIQVPSMSPDNQGYDTYLVVYKATATTDYAATTSYNNPTIVLTEDDQNNPIDATLEVEPNVTYVIKIGSYNDCKRDFTYTNSTVAGKTEEIQWEFTPDDVFTYSGDLGDLALSKRGGMLMGATLDGEPLTDFSINGNVITTTVKTVDTTDVTNIGVTTTTTTFTLDGAEETYTATIEPTTIHPFTKISESAVMFSKETDSTGNNWVSFTPSRDGVINITETSMGTITDSYLAVYDLTELDYDLTKLKRGTALNANAIAYSDVNPAIITDLSVTGGHIYIIKHGAYQTKDTLIGEEAPNLSYVGTDMTFDFSYRALSMTSYMGDEGELAVYRKEDDTFDHATLGGERISGAYEEGNRIIIKGNPVYDLTTDPENPTVTSTDTVFTLSETGHSYVVTNPSDTDCVIKVLTESSTGLSGVVGVDANLWATFTPSEDGFIDIDETIQATNGASHDTLVAVYEKRETGASLTDYVGYSSETIPSGSLRALNSNYPYSEGSDNGLNPTYVHGLPVEAGKTYIIKIGAFAGNNCSIGQSTNNSSAFMNSMEAFDFSFYKSETATYIGEEGVLSFATLKGKVTSATVGGSDLSLDSLRYNEDEGTLSVEGTHTYDLTTNKLDPTETSSQKTYVLNKNTGTYTVSNDVETKHLFQEITDGVQFTGTTGTDGSYYAKYTATANGTIRIKDIALASSNDYVIVYEATTSKDPSSYKGNSSSSANGFSCIASVYCSVMNTSTSDIEVTAGKTYIIKVCSASAVNYGIGQTASADIQGKTGTIELTFVPTTEAFIAGEQGILSVSNRGSVSLNGMLLENAVISEDGKTVTVYGEYSVNSEGEETVLERSVKTFTISNDGTTYTYSETIESTPIVTINATDVGTYTTSTGSNGLALMKFVVPEDGTYTVSALIENIDNKLGIYTDLECTTLLGGASTTDTAYTGRAETITFTATAGQVLYFKTAHYSKFTTSVTSTEVASNYANKTTTFTITKDGSGSSSSSSSTPSSGDGNADDYFDDLYS